MTTSTETAFDALRGSLRRALFTLPVSAERLEVVLDEMTASIAGWWPRETTETAGTARDRVSDERLREILDGCEGVQGGPWKLDKFAAYVWAPSEKGGDFPLMDEPGENGRVVRLRGWSYYTGNGSGALGLSHDDAVARQRQTGAHIGRLDPGTVSSIVSELLALRSAPATDESRDSVLEAAAREAAAKAAHAVQFEDKEQAAYEWDVWPGSREYSFELSNAAIDAYLAALKGHRP